MEPTLQLATQRFQNSGQMENCTSMQIEAAPKRFLENLKIGRQASLIAKYRRFLKDKM